MIIDAPETDGVVDTPLFAALVRASFAQDAFMLTLGMIMLIVVVIVAVTSFACRSAADRCWGSACK